MQRNATETTEKANRVRTLCGACHDDVMLFGHGEAHGRKCQNDNLDYGNKKFQQQLAAFPKTSFENSRDWSRALEEGLINPDRFLKIKQAYDTTLNKEQSSKPNGALCRRRSPLRRNMLPGLIAITAAPKPSTLKKRRLRLHHEVES